MFFYIFLNQIIKIGSASVYNALETGVEAVHVMVSDPLGSGRFTRQQLDKKYKHASDFGVADTRKNRETLTKYRDALEAHLNDKDTVEKGTYRR
ncbi:colicin D domain-containing protein [Serratia marcescens]|uniref:colicin D domain-containing protein n=2 Tax=Serratia TaxID=613 RepID=UPI003BFA70A7